MPSTTISINLDPSNNISILVGNKSSAMVSIKNNSDINRLYNMGLYVTVPDGITISTSTVPYTSRSTDTAGVTQYTFINIKDLAPAELPYDFNITFQSATTFKSGATIPFQYVFPLGEIKCEMDTMPRGDYDIGNQKVLQQVNLQLVSSQYSGKLVTPTKVLKGAGTSSLTKDYTQVQTATCTLLNNSVSASNINVVILLNNSCRYIGNITTSGTDKIQFTSPTVSTITINDQVYTQLDFGYVVLSKSSNTIVSFQFAIWDKDNFNNGIYIAHGTQEVMLLNIFGYQNILKYQARFYAMDIILSTINNNPQTDVTNSMSVSYTYKVGQYHDIENANITYMLPDGIHYVSSSVTPFSAEDSPTDKAYKLLWKVPLAIRNSSGIVTINATVDSKYNYKFDSQQIAFPVVAYDQFTFMASLLGQLLDLKITVIDTAATIGEIAIATIKKNFIKAYYQNGVAKTITTLAPGDLAEYQLIYKANTLKAVQKQVYIDDFFPFSANPIYNLNYSYSGIFPSTPSLISPHGVDFNYGDLPGKQTSTIQFKVPIAILGATYQNNNLMKLKGINTSGIAYSQRDQVLINIGTPNIKLTKSISGPNVSAIKSAEVYLYTIVVANTNTLGTETDAFLFTLQDTFSTWFSYVQGSISVTGTGAFSTPVISMNGIIMDITKLAPGQQLTVTYQVKLSDYIPPGIKITTTATTTNPYSQLSNTSYQYINLNKSASASLSAQPIAVSKSIIDAILQVGSQVIYKIVVVIPLGTIAYSSYLRDTLPSGMQNYSGPSYKNGVVVTPTLLSSYVTFQNEGTLDARNAEITITYQFASAIINATKPLGTINSIQTNTAQFFYKQTPTSTNSNIVVSRQITIQHPNYVLNLTAQNTITGEQYTQNALINSATPLYYFLTIQNNSIIQATKGAVEIPIDTNMVFQSIETTSLCTASYSELTNKVTVTIPQLDSNSIAQLVFLLKPKSAVKSGSVITTQATAVQYFNAMSNKVYGGEQSNIITCSFLPGVSLVPAGYDKLDESTSYRVSSPGETVTIFNYFSNAGGGIDSFSLQIEKVAIPYKLYVENVFIADVAANTLLTLDVPSMQNISPNTRKAIQITTIIPTTAPLGFRYDFKVTAKSKTAPYPQKAVLNIDPR